MNWVLIGNNLINVNQIVRIQRVNANSFTVFTSDGLNFPNLTPAQVSPLLLLIPFE